MLGEIAARPRRPGRRRGRAAPEAAAAGAVPRLTRPRPALGHEAAGRLVRAHAGEVLGVVALEGQGQDELFDILAGSERPDGGELLVDGTAVSFRHPGRRHPGRPRLRAGRPRRGAADAALGPREHRPAVRGRFRRWGPIDDGRRAAKVDGGDHRALQIDTRAASEVRRLSGGNQQKVTIARWVAGGVRTMLCFDPTRGIDIGTKQQIYRAAPRPRGGRRRGPALHLGAQGDPARLRPGDRDLRRPGGRRDRGRGCRRADAAAGRVRPAAGRADARGGRRGDASRPRRGRRRVAGGRHATPDRRAPP